MHNTQIKVGLCVAYDWYLLAHSLPLIYNQANLICLSIDKERISWSGKPFKFDEEGFGKLVSEIDIAGKIKIYEDNFHLSTLSPMQNEVRQRNMMASFLGVGGWHIQLDADEYIIDFASFVQYLKTKSYTRPVNVCCPIYNVYKQVEEGFLMIQSSLPIKNEFFPIATNRPSYEFGRRNGYFNILTDFLLVHQSWARSEDEIYQKINNWGHTNDFDVTSYFAKWKQLSKSNYNAFQNFHPIDPETWEKLAFLKAKNIKELLMEIHKHKPFTIPKGYLKRKNSIWISRAEALVNKIFS